MKITCIAPKGVLFMRRTLRIQKNTRTVKSHDIL